MTCEVVAATFPRLLLVTNTHSDTNNTTKWADSSLKRSTPSTSASASGACSWLASTSPARPPCSTSSKLGECINTIPTIGFNAETVQYKNINFTLWDVGGQDKIRPLWKHYYHNTDAVIFVVDSNDRDRVGVARDELHRLLSEDELSHSHLLVFANKQDLPNAMSAAELTEKLQLQQLRGRQWYIQGACATTGDGLCEGLDWMAKTMRQHDGTSRGVRA